MQDNKNFDNAVADASDGKPELATYTSPSCKVEKLALITLGGSPGNTDSGIEGSGEAGT